MKLCFKVNYVVKRLGINICNDNQCLSFPFLPLQTQTRQRELLQEFSNKKQIGVPVIELLADAIKTFSDSLRQVANKVQSLDPYYFCSCYYIIDILDQSLQTIDRDACGLSEEFRDQILSKLEDSLLHITEKFPLFAHAVWRLTAKLSS